MPFTSSPHSAAWLPLLLLLALILGCARAAAQQPSFLEDERFESLRAELAQKEVTFHEPRTPSEADLEELPARALGPHWSGLDRLELFRELRSGQLEEAAARIDAALSETDSDASAYTVLIELADTSAFSPCEPALRELARRFAESERPGVRDDGERRRRGYLRALAYERVVKDPEAAREAYAALLGAEPLQWLKSPQVRGARPGPAGALRKRRGALRLQAARPPRRRPASRSRRRPARPLAVASPLSPTRTRLLHP